jgi:uncharacterized protein YciI
VSHFAVIYRYSDDTDARNSGRPAHLAFLTALHEKGILVLSGPFAAKGVHGALLFIRAASSNEVAAILDPDPFNVAGIMVEREIQEYKVVFGMLP